MKKFILIVLSLSAVSCSILGGSSDVTEITHNTKYPAKYEPLDLQKLRGDVENLPITNIEWENIIDPEKFGKIVNITAGYDHLYVETSGKQLIVINRHSQYFGGGITNRIINLVHPIKWRPVESQNLPEKIEDLKQRYRDIQYMIDNEIRSGNPDNEKLENLRIKREEVNATLSITAENDNLYFVSGNMLHCYQRGAPYNLKWETDLSFIAGTEPFAYDDFVFIGGIKFSRIFLLDAKTGETIGDFRTQLTKVNRIYYPPTVNMPYMYFSSLDKYLTCYNINNQTSPVWRFPLTGNPSTAPVNKTIEIARDNRKEVINMIIIGSKDHSVYAINAISGSKFWQYRCDSEPTGDIIFLSNGTMLVKTINDYLINLKTLPEIYGPNGKYLGFSSLGEFIWKAPGISEFILETEDYIFAETTDRKLRQIEKKTGKFITDYNTKHFKAFVQNTYDSILYAVSDMGVITALKER